VALIECPDVDVLDRLHDRRQLAPAKHGRLHHRERILARVRRDAASEQHPGRWGSHAADVEREPVPVELHESPAPSSVAA
jgi:hypothetical protein